MVLRNLGIKKCEFLQTTFCVCGMSYRYYKKQDESKNISNLPFRKVRLKMENYSKYGNMYTLFRFNYSIFRYKF